MPPLGDTLEVVPDRYDLGMTIESRRQHLIARNRAQHVGDHLYENREWMVDAYITRRLTLRQVAAEAVCGVRTIARWMATHQIPTRTPEQAYELVDRSGPANPRWQGGLPPCPACGGVKSRSSDLCSACFAAGILGENNPKWRGLKIGYAGAHDRVKTLRGAAGDYDCVAPECGRSAQEWAYDNEDPAELSEGLLRYSADPAHYLPMCRSCHKRKDAARRRAELTIARRLQ